MGEEEFIVVYDSNRDSDGDIRDDTKSKVENQVGADNRNQS